MDNSREDQCIRFMYVTGVTVTGVTFLMDNTSEDQCIGSLYVTGVTVTGAPSLWITAVKISASGLMYVTGVTFLMDNTSEDQCIRSYVCHWCHLPYG